MPQAKWVEYKARAEALQSQLDELRQRPASNDEVLEWLLNAGSHLIGAAKVIIEMRAPPKELPDAK